MYGGDRVAVLIAPALGDVQGGAGGRCDLRMFTSLVVLSYFVVCQGLPSQAGVAVWTAQGVCVSVIRRLGGKK